jgi:hypothetical protein
MGQVYPLGGRIFAPAEQTTSRQDGWVMVQLEDAGVLALLTAGVDETGLRRLIVEAIRSGKYHAIIAGLLIEVDTKWTPDAAVKNAEFFADLTDAEEKRVLGLVFEGVLAAFFLSGGRSLTPSPTASRTDAPDNSANGHKPARRSTGKRAAAGPTAPAGSSMATPTA